MNVQVIQSLALALTQLACAAEYASNGLVSAQIAAAAVAAKQAMLEEIKEDLAGDKAVYPFSSTDQGKPGIGEFSYPVPPTNPQPK